MKKVCFFIPSIDAGGIETYLLRFIRYVSGRMNITVVIRSNKQQGELLSDYLSTDVKLIFMPMGYFSISGIQKYYSFFKANKFDSICDFTGNFAGLTVLIAALTKIKNRVVFYRSGSNHYPPTIVNNIYNYLSNKLVLLFATNILANSIAGLNFFFPKQKGKVNKKYGVVRNGIDEKSLMSKVTKQIMLAKLDINPESYIVVHSGRLDKSKNHITMLKVAKEIIYRNPNVYFVFCGKNTEIIQNEVDNMSISKNIRLLGYRNDVSDILKSADLFFFPSVTEGQPNALIEAMIVGLPFVASDIEPIKESIPENMINQLANPYDVDKFVSIIQSAIDNKNLKDCSESAKIQFSASKNFELFYNCL